MKKKLFFWGGFVVSLIGAVVVFAIFDADLSGGWKFFWILVVAFLALRISCFVFEENGGKAITIGAVALVAVFVWRNFEVPHNPPLRHHNWWAIYYNAPKPQVPTKFNGGVNLETDSDFQGLLRQEAEANGLSINLVRQVIKQESNWDPSAISKKGYIGLMQLGKVSAREEGLVVNNHRDDRYDPILNVRAGCSYLSRMLAAAKGDVALGLAYYNAGPNASPALIKKVIREYSKIILAQVSVYDQSP